MDFYVHQLELAHRTLEMNNSDAWDYIRRHTICLKAPGDRQMELIKLAWALRRAELKRWNDEQRAKRIAKWTEIKRKQT